MIFAFCAVPSSLNVECYIKVAFLLAKPEVAADGEWLLLDLGLLFYLGRNRTLALDPLRTRWISACRFAFRAPGLPLAVGAAAACHAVAFLLAVGAGVARRADVFHPAMGAGAAVLAAVFQPAVGAGAARCAAVFPLAMKAGVARRAVAFLLAVRAGGARRALAFHLAVGTGVALCAHVFPLPVGARVAYRTAVLHLAVGARTALRTQYLLPPVRASFVSHSSRATKPVACALLRPPQTSESWLFTNFLFVPRPTPLEFFAVGPKRKVAVPAAHLSRGHGDPRVPADARAGLAKESCFLRQRRETGSRVRFDVRRVTAKGFVAAGERGFIYQHT